MKNRYIGDSPAGNGIQKMIYLAAAREATYLLKVEAAAIKNNSLSIPEGKPNLKTSN